MTTWLLRERGCVELGFMICPIELLLSQVSKVVALTLKKYIVSVPELARRIESDWWIRQEGDRGGDVAPGVGLLKLHSHLQEQLDRPTGTTDSRMNVSSMLFHWSTNTKPTAKNNDSDMFDKRKINKQIIQNIFSIF